MRHPNNASTRNLHHSVPRLWMCIFLTNLKWFMDYFLTDQRWHIFLNQYLIKAKYPFDSTKQCHISSKIIYTHQLVIIGASDHVCFWSYPNFSIPTESCCFYDQIYNPIASQKYSIYAQWSQLSPSQSVSSITEEKVRPWSILITDEHNFLALKINFFRF